MPTFFVRARGTRVDSRAAQRGADFRTVCAGDGAHACVVRQTREAGPGAFAHRWQSDLIVDSDCHESGSDFGAVTHGSLLRVKRALDLSPCSEMAQRGSREQS